MNPCKITWLLITFFLILTIPEASIAGGKTTRTPPLVVNFVNQAADVSGLWDASIRSEFLQAMNVAANDVSAAWLKGRPILVGAGLKSRTSLIVVDHPIYFGSTQVGGYHDVNRAGTFAIFDLTTATQDEGPAGPFLFGSHELDEMLVDPHVNRFADRRFVEIADPAVCCHYDLTLADNSVVALSDFVLPAWFNPNGTGPFDFIESPYIQAPFQYGPDGY